MHLTQLNRAAGLSSAQACGDVFFMSLLHAFFLMPEK